MADSLKSCLNIERGFSHMAVTQQTEQNDGSRNRRKLDDELDRLEQKIAELRVYYEQYFVDIQPQPPDKLQQEVVWMIRQLLRAPFKNAAIRFRLRELIQRYQMFATYWEKVMKLREEGKYVKDQFKAELREKSLASARFEASQQGKAEKGMKQLYDSYESALRKTGVNTKNISFDSFKKSLLEKAKAMQEKHGAKKLHYKIVVKDGKVTVKATPK